MQREEVAPPTLRQGQEALESWLTIPRHKRDLTCGDYEQVTALALLAIIHELRLQQKR